MRCLIALTLVAATAGAQPVPPAQPAAPTDATERAKELYAQGKRYYDVADYPRAIDAWKQAYLLSSAPMLLFNIAQAYRLSGDCTSALRFYANYEREAGSSANAAELEQAKARCNPQPTSANEPPSYPPPKPAPAASSLAEPPDLDRAPPAASHDDGGTGDRAGLRTAGIATGIGGAVVTGFGIYLATVASHDAHVVSGYTGAWGQSQRDTESNGKSAAMWSGVSIGVGVAAIATGGVLYFLGRKTHGVAVAAGPHTTELTWTASF
jgi:hypothetical protein